MAVMGVLCDKGDEEEEEEEEKQLWLCLLI